RLSGLAGWMVWMFVHLAFLNGWGSRTTTMLRWIRWLAGHNRTERVFNRSHTGGDISTPESVRAVIQPTPYPENPLAGWRTVATDAGIGVRLAGLGLIR